MTAKEYLSQAYRLNQLANTKMEQIENLRALSEKVTASYGGEQVSHSRNVTSLEDTIVRIVAAQGDLNRQLNEIVRLQVEISSLIDKVQNVNYSEILTKRYLRFMPWNRIASEMGYSRRWVLQKHGQALEVVERLLKEKEEAV
ncbi:MAG: DUF1492 domain-containing protein [Oscillospiraceae bacterium]|nr:DUF1492 domain-containing protein [Oscillospiraceae bacterium]